MSKQALGVSHLSGRPLVTLTFGRTAAELHYTNALQFAQWVRLHAKEARRENRDHSTLVFDDALYDNDASRPYVAHVHLLHAEQMAAGNSLAARMNVAVDHVNEYVRIQFGANARWAIHYTDAFPFARAIRAHARAAKHDVGDTSTLHLAAGVLSDAEENYRLGI